MKRTWLVLPALACAATIVVVACSDPSPLAVRPRGLRPQADLVDSLVRSTGLLKCSPIPYDSVTQTIGPLGGTLQVGPHTLSVPPGALLTPLKITAVAPSDTVNVVHFQPEGLTFGEAASLTLSYANCDLLGLHLPKRIAYVSDSLSVLDYLPSEDDMSAQVVTGHLRHFSGYAVDW